MIAVFAAMTPEVSACFSGEARQQEGMAGGYPVIYGEGFAVCKTGIGRVASEVADAVVEALAPSAVLSVGLCGGLAPDLEIGELIAARHVDHEEHRSSTEQLSIYCDERLMAAALKAAAEAEVRASEGSCLTVDEAAWGPAEKAALHAWKAHEIVEMESFWVGRAAMRHEVPFLTSRTVSDAADHRLHQTGAMRADGTFDAAAFQAWTQANPHLVAEYATQAERARMALGNLSRFLAMFLPSLPGELRAAETGPAKP